LGAVIRFIPYPVTVGFTSGIALIIAVGEIPDAFGLAIAGLPDDFLSRLEAFGTNAGSIGPWAAAVCAVTIGITLVAPRLKLRVPGPLIALVATTAIVQVAGIPVETIQDRFGSVPSGLPMPRLPSFDLARLPDLVSPAISIALLGGIESLLSAVVADGMTGRRHRSNVELVAQGIANLASPLFGGIPATGAIARTATNVKNGARTPVAGMIHALTLLSILVFAGRWASLIPMATLAGILLVVAYNMSEWRLFAGLLRGPRSDVAVLLATFLLTVLVDLATAIQVGVVLAALLFMRRMAEITQVRAVQDIVGYDEDDDEAPSSTPSPPGVEVYEILGTFCFGATQKFMEVLGEIREQPRYVILRMRHVLAIDATGLRALDEGVHRLRRGGTTLLLSGVQPQVRAAMARSGTLARVGPENVFETFNEALKTASNASEGQG
jgi:SulP family sulfate permease